MKLITLSQPSSHHPPSLCLPLMVCLSELISQFFSANSQTKIDATDCNVPRGRYKRDVDATDCNVPGGCCKKRELKVAIVDATDCNVPGGCYKKEKSHVDATDCNVPRGCY